MIQCPPEDDKTLRATHQRLSHILRCMRARPTPIHPSYGKSFLSKCGPKEKKELEKIPLYWNGHSFPGNTHDREFFFYMKASDSVFLFLIPYMYVSLTLSSFIFFIKISFYFFFC